MACYRISAGIGLTGALALGWVEISLATSLPDLVALLFGLLCLVAWFTLSWHSNVSSKSTQPFASNQYEAAQCVREF